MQREAEEMVNKLERSESNEICGVFIIDRESVSGDRDWRCDRGHRKKDKGTEGPYK